MSSLPPGPGQPDGERAVVAWRLSALERQMTEGFAEQRRSNDALRALVAEAGRGYVRQDVHVQEHLRLASRIDTLEGELVDVRKANTWRSRFWAQAAVALATSLVVGVVILLLQTGGR